MKYECELMRDLMPLVKDGISSVPSAKAVNEHIKQCEECRKYYSDIFENTVIYPQKEEPDFDEIKQVAEYSERIKKHRRKIIIIVASVIGCFLLLCTTLILLINGLSNSGGEFKTKDVSQYGIYSGHIEKEKEGLHSYLMVFPKTLPHSAKVKDYYYFCSSKGVFDNSYQIYLEYTLDKNDYVAEIKRLSDISMKYKDTVHNIIYDTTGFNYPAYIMIFDNYGTFEYALTDDVNHKIVCVYSQKKGMGIDTKIVDNKYLSKSFTIPDKLREPNWKGYNMYYFPLNGNDHMMPSDGEFN